MNKGTAIVGMLLSFVAGMGLMYGIDKSGKPTITAHSEETKGEEVKGQNNNVPAEHSSAAIPVKADDPTWGNVDAPITIVEFSDYECPFCSRGEATVNQIKKEYGPEKVRIVWKNYPLPFHKNAKPAHLGAIVAFQKGGNNAFWKYHELAFAHQKALTEENILSWLGQAGVKVSKEELAKLSAEAEKKLKEDMELANKVGVRGTPHFKINGVTVNGAQPFPQFKAAIDKELQEVENLKKSGVKPLEVYAKRVASNHKNEPEPQKEEEKVDTNVYKVPVLAHDPAKGPADALVTVVVFSDSQCPFCSRVEPTLKQVMDTYKDKVRIVWKDYPLSFHDKAKRASQFAGIVFEKKGNDVFWQVHDKLFEKQKELGDELYQALAKEVGLDWDAVKKDLDANKFDKEINEDMDSANMTSARGGIGTPAMFINGRSLSGAQPFEAFKALIDEQIGVANKMVESGVSKADLYNKIMEKGIQPGGPEKFTGTIEEAIPAYAAVKGNKDAKIVIHEFSDFECPFCSRVNPSIKQIMETYGDKVKVVWRNYPLPFHKSAPLAAEAALEVKAQKGDEAFWKFHDVLFANQKDLSEESLIKYAKEIEGINIEKFTKALKDHTHKSNLDADMEAAKKANVSGTPGFVIGGKYFVSGARPFGYFKMSIDAAMKELNVK